jgi:DNA-directed RNA polymerase specialized sigma24 family protein
MRHLRELLRLHHVNRLPQQAIAKSLGLGQGTVSKYLGRASRRPELALAAGTR